MLRYLLLIFIAAMSCKPGNTPEDSKRLPFYSSADFAPQWMKDATMPPDTFHRIPPFSFTNQYGEKVTEQTTRGKIYVADFFFTRCPGICPILTKNMLIVQQAIKNDSEVLLLSHSVTPETDSVPQLAEYAKEHSIIPGKWHLLTGNRDSIYKIARQSYFADEDLGMVKSASEFLHTENMLLIDKERHIRGIYKGTSATEMQNLITDIKLLELEYPDL